MACSIRARVSGVTFLVLFTTNETVAMETPARSATSCMVAAISSLHLFSHATP